MTPKEALWWAYGRLDTLLDLTEHVSIEDAAIEQCINKLLLHHMTKLSGFSGSQLR